MRQYRRGETLQEIEHRRRGTEPCVGDSVRLDCHYPPQSANALTGRTKDTAPGSTLTNVVVGVLQLSIPEVEVDDLALVDNRSRGRKGQGKSMFCSRSIPWAPGTRSAASNRRSRHDVSAPVLRGSASAASAGLPSGCGRNGQHPAVSPRIDAPNPVAAAAPAAEGKSRS